MPTLTAAIRVLAGLAILVVAACDSTGSGANTTPEPTSAADLAGTAWTMVSIGDTPAIEGAGAGLTFDSGGNVSGSTGCNSISGSYALDGAALTFGPLATTRMACEGVDTWLSGLATAVVSGDTLTVSDAPGAEIGALERAAE